MPLRWWDPRLAPVDLVTAVAPTTQSRARGRARTPARTRSNPSGGVSAALTATTGGRYRSTRGGSARSASPRAVHRRRSAVTSGSTCSPVRCPSGPRTRLVARPSFRPRLGSSASSSAIYGPYRGPSPVSTGLSLARACTIAASARVASASCCPTSARMAARSPSLPTAP